MRRVYSRLSCMASMVSLLGIGLSGALASDLTRVTTDAGGVVGSASKGIESWLGIPYADPPTGKLRWQPPRPVTPWATPIDARTQPSSCPQNAELGVFARAGGREDCLYLNVYRRANSSGSMRGSAVIVWIHGGALQVGQGADYDPAKLTLDGDAILVTLNYRLGLLGFLAHPAIDAEGHEFANYGLMDQRAALQWVQRNIAAFGGDPTNVTIAGESSGGNSVMAHIASPLSAGLFKHAVAMSGGGIFARHPAFGAPMPLVQAREVGLAFARSVACETGGSECLRALPLDRVLNAQPPFLQNEFIIDGRTLPGHPADILRDGRINPVTLVSGSTRDEGRFFVALSEASTGKSMTEVDYPVAVERQVGARLASEVLREYPLNRYDNASEALAAVLTDSMFACPGRAMNRALAERMPVFAYEFADRTAPSYVGPTTFPLLAAHTYELAYLFPNFRGGSDVSSSLNPLQETLSHRMVDFLAAVARLPSREAEWARFNPERDNVMTFALPGPRMTAGRFADAHRCAFWDASTLY